MNRAEKAVESFHNPYTCAQAVYAAFAAHSDPAAIEAMRAFSGGRAPNGECGALYAAMRCCAPELHAALEAAFVCATGATACREIKRVHKTPCAECVRAAAAFLAKENA